MTDGIMMLTGPGRTVHIEAFGLRPGTSAETAIATMTQGAPQHQGELTEYDGTKTRHAFWLTADAHCTPQHEFYGYAATSDNIA